MRALRRVLLWLVDLAAIVVVVWCILHLSRRRSVACEWHGMRASCSLEAENSIGRVQHETIDGIRGAAYLTGGVVGVVTDAQNKDNDALFGTRMIELDRGDDAHRLYRFLDDHDPPTFAVATGVSHPLWTTSALLAALALYAFLSRRVLRERKASA